MSSGFDCAVPRCGKPATCFGAYEGAKVESFACDDHCGHGNEDGHCEPVTQPAPGSASPPERAPRRCDHMHAPGACIECSSALAQVTEELQARAEAAERERDEQRDAANLHHHAAALAVEKMRAAESALSALKERVREVAAELDVPCEFKGPAIAAALRALVADGEGTR